MVQTAMAPVRRLRRVVLVAVLAAEVAVVLLSLHRRTLRCRSWT